MGCVLYFQVFSAWYIQLRYSQLQDWGHYDPYDLSSLLDKFCFLELDSFHLGVELFSCVPCLSLTCQLTTVRIDHLVWLWTRQKMHRFNTQTERKIIQNHFVNTKKPIMVLYPMDKKIQSENYLILFHKYFFFRLHIEISSKIKTAYFWLDLFFSLSHLRLH